MTGLDVEMPKALKMPEIELQRIVTRCSAVLKGHIRKIAQHAVLRYLFHGAEAGT